MRVIWIREGDVDMPSGLAKLPGHEKAVRLAVPDGHLRSRAAHTEKFAKRLCSVDSYI